MSDGIVKMTKEDGETMDIVADNIEQLKKIFPEVFSEDKIDFERLQSLLGEYVNEDEEHYKFTWHGKKKAQMIAQTPSTGTLRPAPEESKNWEDTKNLVIEGDNLEVLKLLQKSYHRKVKMIYIDPPYNTGNEFVYKDDFKDNIKNYREVTGQVDSEGNKLSTNSESNGRYHTDWLNMMYPRLKLARNLLTDDGVIFISIDDNEQANLKKLCDDIFGESNFIGDIIWNSTKSVTNTALISVSHTYNLVYAKNKNYYIENREEFRLKEDGEGFKNPDNDNRGPWKADPFQVGGWRPNQQYDILNPNTKKVYKPNPSCSWKNDYKKFQELLADNRIVFGIDGNAGPQRKRFLSEAKGKGKVTKTLWTDVETTTNGTQLLKKIMKGSYFDNPKPISLIERMLELTTTSSDIILDFFAGSGTTAHAVMQLNAEDGGNRRCISVQLPEPTDEKSEAYKAGYKNIADITKERIRRAGEKIKEEKIKEIEPIATPRIPGENVKTLSERQEEIFNENYDIGFKVFKLDSSNIKTWDAEFDTIENDLLSAVSNIKEDRKEEDILYELLLKTGIDLSTPIDTRTIGSQKIYSIGYGALIICLDKDITQDTIKAVVELVEELNPESTKVIFKDDGFDSDVTKTNAYQTLKRHNITDIKSL